MVFAFCGLPKKTSEDDDAKYRKQWNLNNQVDVIQSLVNEAMRSAKVVDRFVCLVCVCFAPFVLLSKGDGWPYPGHINSR